MKVSAIFLTEPERWGLRGDRVLWNRLEECFASLVLPCDKAIFMEHFKHFFQELTKHPFEGNEDIVVPELDMGGMSGGMICIGFWHEELLPLLLSRLAAIQSEKFGGKGSEPSGLDGQHKDDCLERSYPGVSNEE